MTNAIKLTKIHNHPVPGKGTETQFNASVRFNGVIYSMDGEYSFDSTHGKTVAVTRLKRNIIEKLFAAKNSNIWRDVNNLDIQILESMSKVSEPYKTIWDVMHLPISE